MLTTGSSDSVRVIAAKSLSLFCCQEVESSALPGFFTSMMLMLECYDIVKHRAGGAAGVGVEVGMV